MVAIFIYTLSLNFFKGYELYQVEFPYHFARDKDHNEYGIEIILNRYSFHIGIEDLIVSPERADFSLPSCPFEFNVCERIFKLGSGMNFFRHKNIDGKWNVSIGYLVYSLDDFWGVQRSLSFLFSPSIQIRSEIPKTNLIIGLTSSFYLPFIYFRHAPSLPQHFALFLNIGVKIINNP